jgi:hypothetical protein
MALTMAATATTTGAGTIVAGGIHVTLPIDLDGSGVSVAGGVADNSVEFGVLYSRGLDRRCATLLACTGELGQRRGSGCRRARTNRKAVIDLPHAIIENKPVTTGTTATTVLFHHRGLRHATACASLLLNGHIHRSRIATGEAIAHKCAGLQRDTKRSGESGTSVTPAASTLTFALTLALAPALALTGILHFSI